jgi:V8-like Glu-specific endopeptidase
MTLGAWRDRALPGLAVAAVAVAAVLSAIGCGSSEPSAAAATGAGYWSRDRLLGAQPWNHPRLPAPGQTPSAHTARFALRVGALFARSANGDHFCTASVVVSPGHDLLITAAHCINSGRGGGYNSNIVFIPGYRDGNEPNGVWTPSKLIVDPRWASSADPDLDVGFVVLKPNGGKNIQDVLGANKIAFNTGFDHVVRVTGYPDSSSEPVSCINRTTKQSTHQLKFECGGFPGGTSGSPWVTDFDPMSRTGTIVGVIGGYQEGGDTPSISYSSYLDNEIKKLYEEAGG